MQRAYSKFQQFKAQCHSDQDIIKKEDLQKQIIRLQQSQLEDQQLLTPSDRYDLEKYLKIYRLSVKKIEQLKNSWTKPSELNKKLAYIFDNQKDEEDLGKIMEKSSQIKTEEVQLPSFKKTASKENVIDSETNNKNDLYSPALRGFFQKKQLQISKRSRGSNFKSVVQIQVPNSHSFSSKGQERSISRQQPSQISRSSVSSWKRKPTSQAQLQKLIQQNKKMRQQFQKKLRRESDLNEFQKNLLKEEKNRYMLKIQELQNELENLYRQNYKLKQEEVTFKEKQKKFQINSNSESFGDINENVHGDVGNSNDYYQPYILKTKHNDLKRLNMKCHSEIDENSALNQSIKNSISSIKKQPNSKNRQNEPYFDMLGNQLQKQLKQLEKQKSRQNESKAQSKKSNSQQRPSIFKEFETEKPQQIIQKGMRQNDDILKILKAADDQQENLKGQIENKAPYLNSQFKRKSNFEINMSNKSPFQKKENNEILQDLNLPQEQITKSPQLNVKNSNKQSNSQSRSGRNQKQIVYTPAPNYSFTQVINNDYSINSNAAKYDTFQLTRTYLNASHNEQESETNKYIDARTSTRNKVAFFKNSLILIKNQTFQLAFKRSALVQTKDRCRIIFFVHNKTSQPLKVNFNYEYDAGYFKLKINQKLETVPPNGQVRQDIQVYAYSTQDLNEVIDMLVDINGLKYGLWMPIIWMQFQENNKFKMPYQNETISVLPDRQFKNYETARHMMPIMFGGVDAINQWAYLYGICKFGPCFIKLTWEEKQLKIQTNAKWIDLLAFIFHHVK